LVVQKAIIITATRLSEWNKKVIGVDTEPTLLAVEFFDSFGNISKRNQLKLTAVQKEQWVIFQAGIYFFTPM